MNEHATVVDEITTKARELESDPSFPRPYVEQVRAAVGWLGAGDSGPDDVRHAALLLSRQAQIDLEPPMAATGRARRLVKYLVRRLVGWYVRFLGQQVSALGQASSRLGLAVAGRVERLEADQASDRQEILDELAVLRARVAELEARLGPR